MSTSIASFSRASMLAAAKALNESVISSGVPTHKYLAFNAQHAHYYEKENDKNKELEIGKVMALNWTEILHGFICWKDRKPHDQINWNIREMPTLPDMDQLPDHGPYVDNDEQTDGWIEQITLPLKDLETGTEYLYKTGPISSVRSVRKFLRDFEVQLTQRLVASDDDDFYLVPKVILGKSSFKPRGRNNYVSIPEIKIAEGEWLDRREVEFTSAKTLLGSFMKETLDGGSTEKTSANKVINASDIEE